MLRIALLRKAALAVPHPTSLAPLHHSGAFFCFGQVHLGKNDATAIVAFQNDSALELDSSALRYLLLTRLSPGTKL